MSKIYKQSKICTRYINWRYKHHHTLKNELVVTLLGYIVGLKEIFDFLAGILNHAMMGSLEFSNIIVPVFVTNLVILIIFLSPSATSGSTIEGNACAVL